MRRPSVAQLSTAGLAVALSALMAVHVLTESRANVEPGPSSSRPTPSVSRLALPDGSVTVEADTATILTKPAFRQDRTRSEPIRTTEATPAASDALPSLEHYRLVGLVIAGADSLALVQSLKSGQTVSVTKDDQLDGWHVSAITTDGLTVVGEGMQFTLTIPKQDGTPSITSTAETREP